MDHLYQQCISLLAGVQQQVHELVSGLGIGNEQALESKISDGLEQLEQDTFRLQTMVRKEPPSRRRGAQHNVEQLMADLRVVQNAYRNYEQRKAAAEREAQQREELLSHRYTTNRHPVACLGVAVAIGVIACAFVDSLSPESASQQASESDTKISIDPSLHHHQRLEEANRGLDNVLSHGADILGNLKAQRFTLKGVQRKMLDVANTLGLSNTVMRLIEKRTTQDWWIFWSGVVISSLIIILVIYYFVS